jgi:dinuclear metal center YbgI/SA1388 family protein
MTHLTNKAVFKIMDQWAPKNLAYEWDNVGLQIGSYNKPVKKVMITLDVLESVVDEAIENQVDLIIAHHPLLFKSIKQINTDTPAGRVMEKLIKHDITVYAAHTNLDAAEGGVNDMLCDRLGVDEREVLIETGKEQLYKLAVYVPSTHLDAVRDVLSVHGAGHIGNYSHCTFQTLGQGTFKPLAGTDPFIGSPNETAFVDEIKIETIIQESKLTSVIHAMIKAHPYEEVAYDVFPLKNAGKNIGIGRIGTLTPSMNVEALCAHVKAVMDISHLRVIGDLTKKAKKVAILGGSGEKYIQTAKQKGADVYITGDITFHMAQDAWVSDIPVIDAGHYIEKVMKHSTKNHLVDKLQEFDVEIIISKVSTDPFQMV